MELLSLLNTAGNQENLHLKLATVKNLDLDFGYRVLKLSPAYLSIVQSGNSNVFLIRLKREINLRAKEKNNNRHLFTNHVAPKFGVENHPHVTRRPHLRRQF